MTLSHTEGPNTERSTVDGPHTDGIAIDDVEGVVARLVAELADVRAELAALQQAQQQTQQHQPVPAAASPAPAPGTGSAAVGATGEEPATASRRQLFVAAGGAAAAAAALATGYSAAPAAAANGSPIAIAAKTSANAGPPVRTVVDYSPATSNTLGYFLVTDGTDLTTPPAFPSALAGEAHAHMQTGVYGLSDQVDGNGVIGIATTTAGPSGYGVWGQTVSGAGVVGSSSEITGYDFKAAGQGRILVNNHTLIGPPTTNSYLLGEIIRDMAGDWYVCYQSGTPGLWRKLGGGTTAGALHVVNPTRVYDSRLPGAGGALTSGDNRIVNVSNGIDINTGAVTAANLVPTGATAIAYNLTIANATNGGFLSVAPGSATAVTASTINWTAGTPFLANGTLVKLDSQRQVKVFAGGGGTADFIIDITGFYI